MFTEDKIESLIKEMTVEEKINLLTGVDFFHGYEIKRLGIRALELHDSPFGVRIMKKAKRHNENTVFLNTDNSEEEMSTAFPTGCAISATFNKELTEKMGEALGAECTALGANVILGPGLNIKRNPLCGRNFEYLSEDPYLSGKLAAAYIRGVQKNGVAACPKHFFANNQERGRNTVSSEMDERTMRELYLKGFEIAVKESNPWSIMCSYNRINGVYASENKQILRDILRDEWHFDGAVVSDWGAVKNRAYSLDAGIDLAMPDNGGFFTQVKEALECGSVTKEQLDESVREILRLLGRTDTTEKTQPDFERSYQVSLDMAREAVTLLKNNSSLPLDANKIKHLLVIGDPAETPLIHGNGSSKIKNPYRVDKPIDFIRSKLSKGTELEFLHGHDIDPTYSDIGFVEGKIGSAAQKADAIIVFLAQSNGSNSEAIDRNSVSLDPMHEHYLNIAHNNCKNVIAVLNIGGMIETRGFADCCDSILVSWLGGEAMGRAVAEILFGEVNPSGRLAETFAHDISDIESFKNYSYDMHITKYKESFDVGYRLFDDKNLTPDFEFGYGLSYTTFAYSDIKAETVLDGKIKISAKIKNTGKVAGKEAVQLYVEYPETTRMSRPKKELKGFEKISLNPGETKEVTFSVCPYDISYYNPTLGGYFCDKGVHRFLVAASSRDIKLSAKIKIDDGLHLS